VIRFEELNPHNYPTTADIEHNLEILLARLNIIRAAWDKPMIVTSGLRSEKQQQELIAHGVSKAIKSNHLTGSAADIYDPEGHLYYWVSNNRELLIHAQLWCETKQGNWVHFQICPPHSNERFFNP